MKYFLPVIILVALAIATLTAPSDKNVIPGALMVLCLIVFGVAALRNIKAG
jgi:hypothetical protein